jgi:tetratricopeptide (TPR) repeat protein
MKTFLIFGFLICSIAVFGQTAAEYNQTGNAKYNLGQYEAAILDYDKAIQIDPNYKIAYSNRGLAKNNLGQYEAAILDFDKAIQIDPNFKNAYNNRGFAKNNLGQYEAAILDFDKAIQIDPNFKNAYNNRGFAKKNLGQYEAAILDYDKAIQIDPNFKEAYYNRGSAKDKLGQYEAAILDYDKAIQIDPNYELAYYNRGFAKNNLGQYEAAALDFEKAIKLNPNDKLNYYQCGKSKYYLKQYEAAIKDFDKCLAIDPNYTLAKDKRATAQKKLNEQPKPKPKENNNLVLFWLSPNPDIDNHKTYETQTIKIMVRAVGSANITQGDFKVMVNNREMSCKLGERSLVGSTFSTDVCLNTGNNAIKVCYQDNCTNILNVGYQPQKPNLHILSIGPSFPNLKYTTKDATDFADLFQGQTKLYNQRNINVLKNDKATASKIKTEMSRLKLQYKGSVVSSQDVVIIFISSHGIVLDDDQQVRIKGADYDAVDKEATTVAFTEMIDRLDEIECKKIVFIDACFSGVLDPKLLASKSETSQLEVAKALKILTQKQNGWTIFSSSGNEVSWEHPDWQNGAFTEAIIEGLKYGKADYDGNKIVTTTELYRYLNLRVPKLNTDKGFPIQYPQMTNNLGELPIFAY